MKNPVIFLYSIIGLILLQSCIKSETKPRVIVDPYTYAAKFNWYEDSIKTGNSAWVKVNNGNSLSWLSQANDFRKSNFATYSNPVNIKTNFSYVIKNDSVFAIKLSSDSVFFMGSDNSLRSDLVGELAFSTDTSLLLKNTGVTPTISIRYKLKK